MNKYIDSHTHLHSYTIKQLLYQNTDVNNWQQAWINAQNNHVCKILNIYDITDNDELNIMPEMINIPNIYLAAAVHPCNVHIISIDQAKDKIINIIDKIHCIGETGIDIFKNTSNLQDQINFFKLHIELAHTYNKPLSIHYRNNNENNDEFIRILYDLLTPYPNITFVMHCCTFNYETIKSLLNFANCFISISGIVTYKNGYNVQDLAIKVPIDRLLIETDSPFLTPEMLNINRYKINNESAYISHIYDKVSTLRNMDLSILQSHIYNNFIKFLNIKN